MSRLWVGGATGFLGGALVRHLTRTGHEVVAVSSRGGRVGDIHVEPCDTTDAAAVERSARGCDGAFLCVGKVSRRAEDASPLHALHVVGTRQAMQGLQEAGVSRVVCASTSGTVAVGEDPERVYREDDPAPMGLIGRWPYYRTKLYGEQAALQAASAGRFDVVVVNPSLLLGPGDLRESSTGDVRRFLERQIPVVPRGGLSFVDVRDVAEAMLSALERGRSGQRYLLGGANMTMRAFFERLSRLSGVPAPSLALPKGRGFAVAAHRIMKGALSVAGREPEVDEVSVEMAQCYWYCDSSKAQAELGFSPRDPGDTLRDTVEDLVARGVAFPREKGSGAFAPAGSR